MLQRIFMIILIIVIVIGGGLYAYKELMPPVAQESTGPIYSTKEVTKGNIAVGVETTGRLDPSNSGGLRVPGDRYNPAGSIQAIIEEYLVEEGDSVTQGQVVARLKSPDLEQKIKNKKEELQMKRKQLSDISLTPVEEVDNLNPFSGITILAPISGLVTDLSIQEGEKLKVGETITHIVDNSKYILEAKLYETEYKKVKKGQKVVLNFDYFEGQYEGTVTNINPNRVPYKRDKEEFATSFVYLVTIQGDNMGLVQRDMKVRVGVRDEEKSNYIHTFSNPAEVTGFIEEERVMNTAEEAIVTRLHVENMADVKKGDPLITMAGSDIQKKLQEQMDDLRALKIELNELTAKLDDLEVKAPMDGIVANLHRQVGEQASGGDWIGSLYTVSDMWMWTQVDDIDILHVTQGAPVKVTVDALPGQTFEGVVENVDTMAREDQGVAKFGVGIKVKGGPELRPGMQARAFIDAGSEEGVLLVPLEAIFEEDGKSMVEILNEDGITEVVSVKLGLMNDRVAEVKSGLEEGQKVVTGSSAELLPSQHIKNDGGLLPDKPDNGGDESDGNTDNQE